MVENLFVEYFKYHQIDQNCISSMVFMVVNLLPDIVILVYHLNAPPQAHYHHFNNRAPVRVLLISFQITVNFAAIAILGTKTVIFNQFLCSMYFIVVLILFHQQPNTKNFGEY